MRYLLAAAHVEMLARFAWSNMVLALDFDGTLAPIVPRPDNASMRERTRTLLAAAAQLYPVAILSGRARADVASRLAQVRVQAIIGNHGLEPSAEAARCRRIVSRWLPSLRRALGNRQGVEIEDKAFSVAIHYRRARARADSLAAIHRAIDGLSGPKRILGGKLVVNLLPPNAPHKGIALMRLRRELSADTAIYVGDDITDEDVFALDDPGRLLSIRVGRSPETFASYYLKSQRDIDRLLQRLVDLRTEPSSRREVG